MSTLERKRKRERERMCVCVCILFNAYLENVICATIITYHGDGVSVYRRKWLPPPLRKLSQGKVEKTNTTVPTSSSPLIGPSLKKSNSDKRFKLPSGVEHNRPGKAAYEAEAQEGEEIDKEEEGEQEVEVDVDVDVTESEDTTVVGLQEQNGGEDGDDDLELPPPMKPITESILVTTANGPSGSTIPNELSGKRVSILRLLIPLAHSICFLLLNRNNCFLPADRRTFYKDS